jgi:hypothetical protein
MVYGLMADTNLTVTCIGNFYSSDIDV